MLPACQNAGFWTTNVLYEVRLSALALLAGGFQSAAARPKRSMRLPYRENWLDSAACLICSFAEGTWEADLAPVRQFTKTIALSTLKSHPKLSQLKFVQQTQMSISGITTEQLIALDQLLGKGELPPDEILTEVDRLCAELEAAQHDTKHSDRFEAAIADAFSFLGFETDHIGGPGKADVLLKAGLGSGSYTAVADAKTCQPGATLSSPNCQPINDHKEQNSAEYAVLVAPA